MAENKIQYSARTYDDYRKSLLDISRKYYPDMADSFNDASVGQWLIELCASVGDELSYHIDRTYQETSVTAAGQRSSLNSIARNNGIKIPGKKAAIVEIELSCELPLKASGDNSNGNLSEADTTYAPIVKRGALFSTGLVTFELVNDVNFGEQFDENGMPNRQIIPNRDSNGNIIINGGTIDITGQSAFDYDGNAQYNGGTLIVNGQQVSSIPNQMMGGGGPMITGQWINQRTGERVTVRDSYMDGENMFVILTNGRQLTMEEFQDYVQMSDDVYDEKGNKIGNEKPLQKKTAKKKAAYDPNLVFDGMDSTAQPIQSDLQKQILAAEAAELGLNQDDSPQNYGVEPQDIPQSRKGPGREPGPCILKRPSGTWKDYLGRHHSPRDGG